MTIKSCLECETELTLTGVTHRHGSEHYHCENCHLDQTFVKDANGPSFMQEGEQHSGKNCEVCADGGPTKPHI
jgi:hypothetical protein